MKEKNEKAIKSILDFHFPFFSYTFFFARNNDLFISCLMQASSDFIPKYFLEVAIRKSNTKTKILSVELINRNEIYCLEATSWRVI